jgi:hypothetical protein
MKALDIIVEGETPFADVPYYFASAKGWYTNMPTLFGVGQTPLKDGPPGLPTKETAFELNDRWFPEQFIDQAHAFFKAVFAKQKTESSLYIIYNRQQDEFKLWCPEQYVTHTSVNHRLGVLPLGWTAAGTIHSHCDFSAFHSGTDQHDMEGMPGLHITLGHVNRDTPETAIALSLGSNQFDVDYENIISSADEKSLTFPTHWLQFVKQGNAPWNNGVKTSYKPKPTSYGYGKGYSAPKSNWKSNWNSKPTKSQLQQSWDWQAWHEDELYFSSHEPTRPVGALDPLAKAFDESPSDLFAYHRDELADIQYELSMITDQLEEMGFDFEWSIAAENDPEIPSQQEMFNNAPTP